ncbi:MAG: oligoendopeptidase F, partial [Clostridiales bacterium]|nr:oligoendopeptidase F [Candidatus Apopatousia equi]
FKFYDVYLSLASKLNKKFDLDEQKEIVKKALINLGDDYQKLLDKAYSENWMDVYPNNDKASGGYCLSVYGLHPYVLLNNNDNYDSMSTMAHELGHAMHGYYSNKEQPISTADHAIYIAEIASTTNEVLLAKYMIKNAKTDEEKLFYLGHLIESFKGTVFRQTMFSEFEDYAFKEIEKGSILTQEKLNNKYKSLLEKHFGGVVKIDDNIINEWTRISHFFRPYYVYKYATSFISAVNIASKIEKGDKEAIEKYKTLLKSGGNDYPDKLLKKAGVDLEKDETYVVAFNVLKEALNEVKQILKKQRENTKVIEK